MRVLSRVLITYRASFHIAYPCNTPPPAPPNFQPIVHKFDHAYVASVLKAYPDKFKGVCLANPTLGPEGAAAELANLHSQGAPVCFDM